MDPDLGVCLFLKRRWRQSGWLWCCRRSCWWCSRRITKWSSPADSGRGRKGASERRVQSRSTPSKAKPGSLWTCGLALSPAATPRVCYRSPDCTRGSPHSLAHPGILWCWLSSRLRRCEVAWCGPHLNHTNDHNRSQKLCFYHPGHVPVICGNPDLHFEGVGNGSVVITWIGSERELYSSTSPISLIEHCVSFRHDRRFLSLLGFVHNWPTSRWSATKKENQFSLNGNGIMSSFLGRQFYHSTLYYYQVFNFPLICYYSISPSSVCVGKKPLYYNTKVIKISISFPTSVLVIFHLVTFC